MPSYSVNLDGNTSLPAPREDFPVTEAPPDDILEESDDFFFFLSNFTPMQRWFLITGIVGSCTLLVFFVYVCLVHGNKIRRIFDGLTRGDARGSGGSGGKDEDARIYTHTFVNRWFTRRGPTYNANLTRQGSILI